MSYWSGEKLIQNKSVITDFEPEQVDANAYNLRMENCYFRTADGMGGQTQTKITLAARQPFIIPAGQFAFLLSRETVNVPANAMAFISMRTGIKFKGLINVSGFHVDPGYSGKLIYAVFNASPLPVHICEGDSIFKIWFADLDQQSADRYLFRGLPQNDISNDLIRGMSKEIYSLQSLAENMRELRRDMDLELARQKPIVDNLTFVWRAVVLGVIGALIISVLALAWPSLLAGSDWIFSKLNEYFLSRGVR
jgi:dCTP deaminase